MKSVKEIYNCFFWSIFTMLGHVLGIIITIIPSICSHGLYSGNNALFDIGFNSMLKSDGNLIIDPIYKVFINNSLVSIIIAISIGLFQWLIVKKNNIGFFSWTIYSALGYLFSSWIRLLYQIWMLFIYDIGFNEFPLIVDNRLSDLDKMMKVSTYPINEFFMLCITLVCISLAYSIFQWFIIRKRFENSLLWVLGIGTYWFIGRGAYVFYSRDYYDKTITNFVKWLLWSDITCSIEEICISGLCLGFFSGIISELLT